MSRMDDIIRKSDTLNKGILDNDESLFSKDAIDKHIPQTPQEVDDFIANNKWIMYDVIRPYCNLLEYEDLFQEACIGAIKGISTFDPDKGVKLTTYVYACAANEVKMAVRKTNAKKRSATVISIESLTPVWSEKDSRVVDIPDPGTDVEYTACNNILFDKIMKVVNTRLPIPERIVILDFLKGIPQARTAKRLHTSQGHISKLYNQALLIIRTEIDPDKG